ncbi:MAG: hypothetical protein AAGC80_08560 [Rhodococcus sp. (in: high G+C Gram-positive bacteria)]
MATPITLEFDVRVPDTPDPGVGEDTMHDLRKLTPVLETARTAAEASIR